MFVLPFFSMSDNEEILETGSNGEYVTKSELREILAEFLSGKVENDNSGDDSDEWELVTDLDDAVERLTSSDVERIAEEKVQAALAKLTAKRAAAKPSTPAKKAAPKPEPEVEPTTKKPKFGARFWGAE